LPVENEPFAKRDWLGFLPVTIGLALVIVLHMVPHMPSQTGADSDSRGPVLPTFSEMSASAGIGFRHEASKTPQKYLIETMGAGVAVLDYDQDGWMDLYFVNGAALNDPMKPGDAPSKSGPRFWNRLYRNDGQGGFTDTTKAAGVGGHSYGMGAAVGDYNNDGYPDLYVTNFGTNTLYLNEGDGTFTDVTKQAGVSGGGWSTGAVFFDYDKDGRLDLFVARYLDWSFENSIRCGEQEPGKRVYCHPRRFKPMPHLLYQNNGDGSFSDVSEESGIARFKGKGLGVAINDFDRDGWVDLFVANDEIAQQLFHNLGDGTFEDVAVSKGAAYDDDGRAFAGMGAEFSDYTNDGWPDLFANALARQTYAIYRNRQGVFDYVSGPSGVGSATEMHSGWGSQFFDYDNDGWKDLFVAQGHVMDNIALSDPEVSYLEPLLLLRNVFGKFFDVSALSGAAFAIPRAGRGAAAADLDNDGFVDIVVNANDGPAAVLRSHGGDKQGGTGNHWLTVDVIGTLSNRDGIGTRIRLVSESGQEQFGFVSRGGSYLSAGDKHVHFGLGSDEIVERIELTWPSGIVQTQENIKAGQLITMKEPSASQP